MGEGVQVLPYGVPQKADDAIPLALTSTAANIL